MSERIAVLYQESTQAMAAGNHEAAYNGLTQLLSLDAGQSYAYFLLARIAHDFRNYDQEIKMLTSALRLEPENVEYGVFLARAYALKGDFSNALTLAQRLETMSPHNASTYDTLGVVYNRLGMYREASVFFEKATTLEQNNPAVYFNLGSTLKFCGDFEKAREAYEKAIALKPDYAKAHAALTSLGGVTQADNHVARLQSLIAQADRVDEVLHLSHALSKELEALGQFDESFSALREGKRSKRAQLGYHFEQDQAMFSALQTQFAQGLGRARGYSARGPVFVVGMPRSGTTLVERIISNHTRVATAGELPNVGLLIKQLLGSRVESLLDPSLIAAATQLDVHALGRAYVDSTRHLQGDRELLVDKLPLNVLNAGFIAQALPKAKIVCLDRDPLDTLVSNFRQLFSFHDLTYGYSLDLEDCARYCVGFKELVRLWEGVIPENFYRVDYEQLVANPEVESRALMEFLELDWQPECVRIEHNTNPVATASSVQVRRPISQSSVGQWQRYDAHLGPAKTILAEAGLL
ncbi:tetratricopeptide repeat-containing sulfotransferase family protein [Marinimicrobium alkaliphilum]|uniref:tetratricopeptide repeat-containing sulfotransferase family protein n=1 Tax=Marinimicrobium alkaliphilum TaxID=2202654 RepID=UPI000DB96D34|nr:sulfotransferase [Marinimicrobium alkaliphilum]